MNNETDEDNSDANVDKLVETFCSQTLVKVTLEFDKSIGNLQLSPRGRGRGRYAK